MSKLCKSSAMVLGLFLGAQTSSWAVPIGIVDSGTDMKHADLNGKVWINPTPGSAGGDYADDVNGWNFAENNNQIIDYSYLGKFSPDVKKYFEVQLRVIEGTATDEDKEWLKAKRKEEAFAKELSTFANFVHGTHVAGIASKAAIDSRVMAAKIIATEVKLPKPSPIFSLQSQFEQDRESDGVFDDFLLKGLLGLAAGQQSKLLTKVGEYLAKTEMKVANCSFGTSIVQAKKVVSALGKVIFKRDLTDEEADKFAKYFLEQVLEKGATFVTSSEKTLYVMAAGNDGSNNDQSPTFPANLKMDNTITVAATRGATHLASFSNFGSGHVDIAAPGVGILSAIPGGEHLTVSGTSQAAPFVANVVGKILDANPKLSFKDVKKILFDTVDKKDFLKGKVASEGIANEERAVRAAKLSVKLSVGESIQQAQAEILEIAPLRMDSASMDDGDPIPLTSLFTLE